MIMELTIKEEQVHCAMAENKAVKKEPYGNLLDVGSIKIEECNLEAYVQEGVKIEKEDSIKIKECNLEESVLEGVKEEDNFEVNEVHYCSNCDFKCSRKTSLIKHVNTHTIKSVYMCGTSDALLGDENIVNGAVKMEPCYDNFVDVGSIKIEEDILEGLIQESIKIEVEIVPEEDGVEINEVFYCFNCDFRCFRKPSLITHMETHMNRNNMSDKPKHNCSVCEFKTTVKVDLTNHMLIHRSEKPFECEFCRRNYSRKTNLIKHLLIHQKSLKCSMCEYTCSQNSKLTKHLTVHTGKRLYECSVCDFNSLNPGNLSMHMLVHTGEKRFQCLICKQKYARKLSLRRHMLTHRGINNHIHCTLCEYEFMSQAAFSKHMLIHSSDMLYQCSVCEYKFKTENNLQNHMLVHRWRNKVKTSTIIKNK